MASRNKLDTRLIGILRCPVSGLPLKLKGSVLTTEDGSKRYEVVNGIPCLMPEAALPTHTGYEALLKDNHQYKTQTPPFDDERVNNFIEAMIVASCGNLFHGARFSGEYPGAEFPKYLHGSTVLDLGCSWGRWSIAGVKAGYQMVAADIHLEALLCARHLSRKLVPEREPLYVLADARYLPFASNSFGGVFSYSMLQHFSRKNTANILGELQRVMKPGGKSIIQMPNKTGLRAMFTKARIRNSPGSEFDVRYYDIQELLALFAGKIGRSDWFVDCFLGLNVHACDRKFVPRSKRWIVDLAQIFLQISRTIPIVGRLSDSVFITSTKA